MNSAEQTNRFINEDFPVYNEPGPIFDPNKYAYATPQGSWDSVKQGSWDSIKQESWDNSKQASGSEAWAQTRDIFSSPAPTYASPPDVRFDAWGSELITDSRSSFFTEDASNLWNVLPQPIIYQHTDENLFAQSMIPQWDLSHHSYYNLLDSNIPFNHPFDFNNRLDLIIPTQFNEPSDLKPSLDQSLPRNFSQILEHPVVHKKIRKSKTLEVKPSTNQDNSRPGFKCEFTGCGKSFTRPYNLKAHSRIHTQERPFACHICHYAFSRLHDMKRHMNLHSGVKPFQCPHCAKTFARLDALNRHIKKDASTCSSVSRSKFNRTNTL